ncbi:hypothetical protein BKA62DRAFT_258274 [Auriculariales sp. MPI-PUGE-AT-0066]|nr:hypothetical protein BKA62DRAFT_258274 [Auriculariales sp. MPI-PUGE-AT-0066]
MIGTSLAEYVFIRVCIVLLRLVTPVSFGLVAAYVAWWYDAPRWLHWMAVVPTWAMLYPIAECLFYLVVFVPWSRHLRRDTEHPPLRPRREREDLFRLCHENIPDADTYARVWFHGSEPAELRRDNVEDWILWAVFSANRSELDKHPEWREELAQYVKSFEEKIETTLPAGHNSHVKSIRLTLDEVNIVHRPLVWYMIVAHVDFLTFCALNLLGFTHYASPKWFTVFPFRPYTTFGNRSPSEVSYWHRPHRSLQKRPILFIHGLGIGLWAYIRFFFQLVRAEPEVGVLAVELMPISMRITASPVLRRDVMVATLRKILARHEFDNILLIAHSYGSIVAAHLLHAAARRSLSVNDDIDAQNDLRDGDVADVSPKIHSMLLIDPVAILLHLPTTASNFVYRNPRQANEYQLWYFASRDAGIANTLSRQFFWADNLLWKVDLQKDRIPGGAAVVLSERDQITPASDIWTYLTGRRTVGDASEEENGVLRWRSDGSVDDLDLEVLFERGLDHAQIFDDGRLHQVLCIAQRLMQNIKAPSYRD